MDLNSNDKKHYRNLLSQALPEEGDDRDLDIEGYQIIKQIGRGGMSTVYLATETALNRQVALKVFNVENVDATAIERFHQEAIMMADIHHPNTLTIHGVINQSEDIPILVLEYVAGGDLRSKLTSSGCLSVTEAVTIAIDVCKGLEAIHAKSIVHRDINPANILLTKEGSAKVADLGIALNKQSDNASQTLTMTGTFVGTMAYLAPEQLSGNRNTTDTRADIWALGILLFEMVVGTTPQALLVSDILSEVPTPLKPIIRNCLRRNPDDRYSDINELKSDLTKVLTPSKKRPILITTIVISAIVLIGLTANTLTKENLPEASPPHDDHAMSSLDSKGSPLDRHAQVLEALEGERYKWRSPAGIAQQLEIPSEKVEQIIDQLIENGVVVRSEVAATKGKKLFTTTRRYKNTQNLLIHDPLPN
ncbi:MAG: serine/threonine protein kinase [Maribacter stanieri]